VSEVAVCERNLKLGSQIAKTKTEMKIIIDNKTYKGLEKTSRSDMKIAKIFCFIEPLLFIFSEGHQLLE
jgi:hypothetical protein